MAPIKTWKITPKIGCKAFVHRSFWSRFWLFSIWCCFILRRIMTRFRWGVFSKPFSRGGSDVKLPTIGDLCLGRWSLKSFRFPDPDAALLTRHECLMKIAARTSMHLWFVVDVLVDVSVELRACRVIEREIGGGLWIADMYARLRTAKTKYDQDATLQTVKASKHLKTEPK